MFIKAYKKMAVYFGVVTCLLLTVFMPAYASDYYFRPISLAMVGNWRADLEFVVSNPSARPVLLNLGTSEVSIMNASTNRGPAALTVFPQQLLLQPGESKSVTIEYNAVSSQSSYKLVVEQVPVWFMDPGSVEVPKTMAVTRYTANVLARAGGSISNQYAFSGFSEIENMSVPSAMINE